MILTIKDRQALKALSNGAKNETEMMPMIPRESLGNLKERMKRLLDNGYVSKMSSGAYALNAMSADYLKV